MNQLVSARSGITSWPLSKVAPTPEHHIKELEEQLCLAVQKAELFEAVVDVMEKDYGVSVKSGPAEPVYQFV